MPGTLVASGYCLIFLYTVVPGIFPRVAVFGLVTCKRILAKEIDTCHNIEEHLDHCTRTHINYQHQAFKIADMSILTAINSPISTDEKSTPKKAPEQATKSNLSIFHIRIAA